jgi:hypothetical protein
VIAFVDNLLDGHFPFLKTHRLFLLEFGIALLHRVKDVLHVHEDRNSIHGVKAGPITSAKDSA